MSDPIRAYYELGFADAAAHKRKRRIPYNYRLAYVNGRYDAARGKPSRYKVDGIVNSV